jgi:hypothetical protein
MQYIQLQRMCPGISHKMCFSLRGNSCIWDAYSPFYKQFFKKNYSTLQELISPRFGIRRSLLWEVMSGYKVQIYQRMGF